MKNGTANTGDNMGMKMTTTKKTAATYCRISSDLQRDTLAEQQAACARIAERENLSVVAAFADRGKSGHGLVFDRKGLRKLIDKAKRGAFNVVIVESLNCLSRDPTDLHWLLDRLDFFGVEVQTADCGKVARMHAAMTAIFIGQKFIGDHAARIKRGKAAAKAQREQGAV